MDRPKGKEIVGGILRPNAAIQEEYTKAILTMVRRMCEETKREMVRVFEDTEHESAMDASPASQARINLSALSRKWDTLFSRAGRKYARRMVSRTLKNSQVTLGISLKEMSKDLMLDTSILTGDLKEVVKAATEEAAGLIKLIPQKYLGDVQGQVMRSITTGNGLKDLVPYLDQKHDQNIRHARNVAMDQTRKVYSQVNAERMKTLGVKKFKWLHVGGSTHPRELHVRMSGQVYSYDDLPVIDEKTGEKGLPGQAIFCRCVCRPVITFDSDD